MLRAKKGVSLIEVLISIVLAVIVVTIGYRFHGMAKAVWSYAYVQGDLERSAMTALEKMVHGIDVAAEVINGQTYNTSRGLLSANSVVTPVLGSETSQIQFIDPDGMTRSFTQITDRLVYSVVDLTGLNSSIDIIDEGVSQLSFSRMLADVENADDVVYIRLTLQRTVAQRVLSASVETSVIIRNM